MAARSEAHRRPVPTALVTAALVVFSWAWGCSSPTPAPAAARIVKAPVDGGAVALPLGGTLEVDLASNRTTGYSWQIDELPEVIALAGEPTYAPPVGENGSAPMMGAGGTEHWRFVADDSPGAGTLRMSYRRAWEKSVAPAKTYTLEVRVGGK